MNPDFPFWLRAAHLINFVLIGMLLRSGWEVLASLPRLWWRNDCAPGTEWLKFTRRELPKEEGVYTSLMDEKSISPLIGLPGKENVGLGRHWHGISGMLWVLNGAVYITLLFATGLWRRLIPTSWDVFPEAFETLKMYFSFQVPDIEHYQPYDPLQMMGYSFIIFIVAPFMMLTGMAMSPAIRSRFPRFVKFWGGHQGARSLHFIGMTLLAGFIVMHVGLVMLVHREYNVVHMVFGDVETARYAQGLVILVSTVVAVIVFWIALSYLTLANRPLAHKILVGAGEVGRRLFLNRLRPRNATQTVYTDADISEFHWTNGLPPTQEESPEWITARDNDWEGYTLTLGDDLGGPSKVLKVEDLRDYPQTSYIATHTCMQGWSATSRWTGVRLRDLLPERPEGANWVMVESYGLAQTMIDNRPREPFYACYDVDTAMEDDTILAYERNGEPLDLYLGAPMRMRVETNHGYKMVKWVRSIKWIADYKVYGDGRGGTREDSALQAINGRI